MVSFLVNINGSQGTKYYVSDFSSTSSDLFHPLQTQTTFVSSPTCRLCNTTTENNTHFIFLCPLKQQVWRLVWNHFSSRDLRPSTFIHFIHTRDSPLSIFTYKQLFYIFSCTILSIWRSHWSFIFNDTPFIPSTCAISAINYIQTHFI